MHFATVRKLCNFKYCLYILLKGFLGNSVQCILISIWLWLHKKYFIRSRFATSKCLVKWKKMKSTNVTVMVICQLILSSSESGHHRGKLDTRDSPLFAGIVRHHQHEILVNYFNKYHLRYIRDTTNRSNVVSFIFSTFAILFSHSRGCEMWRLKWERSLCPSSWSKKRIRINKTFARWLEDTNFTWWRRYFTPSKRSFVKYFFITRR